MSVVDRTLENRVRLSQASAMVSVQAHCTFAEAMVLMKDRAKTSDHSFEEIVQAVVDRSISFAAQ